jgi:uncharacterized protein (TIGR00369 family)
VRPPSRELRRRQGRRRSRGLRDARGRAHVPRRGADADRIDASAVRASFAQQAFLRFLGIELVEVGDGRCILELGGRPELTQQHGYTHAGVIGALADTAAGYAALSAWPDGSEVLTVEYKLNLVAPATGARLVARAEVVRAGRTITVCESRVASDDQTCAIALVTLIRR